MNAKNSNAKRVQELYSVIRETKERVKVFGVTREKFLSEDTVEMRSVADSLLMCVFRATEEAGSMSEDVRKAFPKIEWRGIYTMRNILAHDYGAVDREIVWASIDHDFPELEEFCLEYAEEHGLEL